MTGIPSSAGIEAGRGAGVTEAPAPRRKAPLSRRLLRLIGLVLLAVLLARADLDQLWIALRGADWRWVGLAIVGMFPMLLLKTLRWQVILGAQGVRMPLGSAYTAYFASLFVGFLTPGRLGEFIRALYVARETEASSAVGFSSVLADRLFDLYALLIVGGVAAVGLTAGSDAGPELLAVLVLITLPLLVYLNDRSYGLVRGVAGWSGPWAGRLLKEGGWLDEMRRGLKAVRGREAVLGSLLTAAAYALFFAECYCLALALGLPIGYRTVAFAIAFGSLVTLLPISISGLGAREAAVVAYLGTAGIDAERALVFSLLVFFVFFVLGGLFGAVAWLLKPVPVDAAAG